MEILGIDVGGSGIKGAIVDTKKGELITERHRISTPVKSTPANVSDTIADLVDHFNYKGPVGCGFPTVIVNGKSTTSGNLDPSWKGTETQKLFSKKTACEFTLMNDADIAGLAEMKFGVGRGLDKMVIMITIGTGLGSGVFYDGKLIPNIELGRIFGKDGEPIEFYAGDKARKRDDLTWTQWGKRFNFFLNHVVRVFSPNHFILGGGASKKLEKFEDQITVKVPIHVAKFRNNAGIIGAALAAQNKNGLK